ncbi:MAG: transcriptional regulator, partial [Alphaproteobacteria bacterium]|nr:transcriptional regulator [Alphaproteobacteria bacterium]
MGALDDLILTAAITPRLAATSKRQAIQVLVETLAPLAGVDARAAFDSVLMRERLSGTGVGDGVAMPHARVAGIKAPIAAFARLDPPIDFGAIDTRPADLMVLLLAPVDRGGDHLKALARLSRFFRRSDLR